jgi:nicotinamidase-related amidase
MLNTENTLFLMIDMQEKLVAATNANREVQNAKKLLKTATVLEVPIIITEQYPKGLGGTVEDLKGFCLNNVFEKTSFSALAEESISQAVANFSRKQVVLFGIETHICAYQTALSLKDMGFDVYIVCDASASRDDFQHKTALHLMENAGIKVTTTEIVVFELLKTSKHPNFKEIQTLIK